MWLLQYVATLLYGGNMNVAMMTAGCALWNDEVVLGSQVVGGWDNTECEAARSEAYIEDVILGEHAPEGRLAVSEADGWVLANIGELPSVRLASSGGLTAEAVRDILVGRLARLRRWLYDLHRGARTGRAAAIMDAGAALMGRSLVLFDGAFNLVAASLVEDEVTQAMRETERRGYASEVSADHQALYRELSLSRPDGFGLMYPEADRLTPVWSQPVAAGSETFRMHVMELMEDDLGEIALAHCVAGELASLLDRSRANDTVNAGMDIVSELLHRQHEEGEARIRARFFGWSIENAWVAARVEAVDQSYPPARWNQIAGMGRSRLEGSHASVPDVDGFALVVPARILKETSREQLHDFCAAEGIVIGWGDPVDGLSGLPASYEQARHACAAARRGGGNRPYLPTTTASWPLPRPCWPGSLLPNTWSRWHCYGCARTMRDTALSTRRHCVRCSKTTWSNCVPASNCISTGPRSTTVWGAFVTSLPSTSMTPTPATSCVLRSLPSSKAGTFDYVPLQLTSFQAQVQIQV